MGKKTTVGRNRRPTPDQAPPDQALTEQIRLYAAMAGPVEPSVPAPIDLGGRVGAAAMDRALFEQRMGLAGLDVTRWNPKATPPPSDGVLMIDEAWALADAVGRERSRTPSRTVWVPPGPRGVMNSASSRNAARDRESVARRVVLSGLPRRDQMAALLTGALDPSPRRGLPGHKGCRSGVGQILGSMSQMALESRLR